MKGLVVVLDRQTIVREFVVVDRQVIVKGLVVVVDRQTIVKGLVVLDLQTILRELVVVVDRQMIAMVLDVEVESDLNEACRWCAFGVLFQEDIERNLQSHHPYRIFLHIE